MPQALETAKTILPGGQVYDLCIEALPVIPTASVCWDDDSTLTVKFALNLLNGSHPVIFGLQEHLKAKAKVSVLRSRTKAGDFLISGFLVVHQNFSCEYWQWKSADCKLLLRCCDRG